MFSLQSIYDLYNQFLNNFPPDVRGIVSLFLAALLVVGIFKVLKREFIYIILLVILLPASIPILKNIWAQLLEVLQFLVNRR